MQNKRLRYKGLDKGFYSENLEPFQCSFIGGKIVLEAQRKNCLKTLEQISLITPQNHAVRHIKACEEH